MKKQRNINFEILRIISMILIISGHYFTHTQLKNVNNFSSVGLLNAVYKPIFVLGVNLFILITGYFQCEIGFKKEKLIRLWSDVIIWSVTCMVIGVIYYQTFANENVSLSQIIKSFFPVFTKQYWFITTYIVLYILSPFINKMLNACTKKEIEYLICCLILFFSVWSSIYPDSLDKTGGFGIIWFCILYISGTYIRRYSLRVDNKLCICGLVLYEITMIAIKYLSILAADKYVSGIDVLVNAVQYKYNFPLVYLASIFVFIIVCNSRKENFKHSRTILYLSSITLDIYLIHENPFIRKMIWDNISRIHLITTNVAVCIVVCVSASVLIYFFGALLVEFKRKITKIYLNCVIKTIRGLK